MRQLLDTHSDKELVGLFREGSQTEKAFRLIVEKYQEKLYWHIRKMLISHDDTDDVLQNTFMKAFQALPGFRADSSLYTWLYRIATNEALTFLKKRKSGNMASMEDVGAYLERTLESEGFTDGEAIKIKLQQAILKLPEKQRIVFNLRYFDEMKYDDMAEVLDTSAGALKASYHHAIKKIEKYLEAD